jgi:hypothetical protein
MSKSIKSIDRLFPKKSVVVFNVSMGFKLPPVLVTVHNTDGSQERYKVNPISK